MNGDELTDINLKDLIERETGDKFNRQNKIKCCFHSDKTASLSVKFNSDANKYIFKCFGCSIFGDAIDFIKEYKNLDYIKAREYLGLTTEKNEVEKQLEKVQGYIDWQIKTFKIGYKLKGLLPYVNEKNEIIYFQAKFIPPDPLAKKECSYYYIENNKVENKRKGEELPYNLYNVINAVKNDKKIILVEGPKDANTINNLLKGGHYVATSIKNVKDISFLDGASIYVCSDTGAAGDKYIKVITEQLLESSKVFKIINLPGIKDLGDNMDITDWLESGHTKGDLLEAFKRSLDLKSKYELQQDWQGIYKTVFKTKNGDEEETKIYLTNFNIISASNIKFINENKEGVKLVLKSSLNSVIERVGEIIVFDDLRQFRNFLGSMDLIFKGKIDDLMDLKIWLKKYFALQDEEIYLGTRFIYKNNEVKLITHDGALTTGRIDTKTLSESGAPVNIIDVKPLEREELQELTKYLFKFTTLSKSFSIIGSVINNFAMAQLIKINKKSHHLLICGESGSGKSTILENVIAPILNYSKNDIKSIGLITKFALIKDLSDGNYPILFEEHKPSTWQDYHTLMLSDIFRNLYDRHSVDRGNKGMGENKIFQLMRPLIMAGEERYSNTEKAQMERSCIVYLSSSDKNEESTGAMNWIIKHEELLNKLGRSLVDEILKLSPEEYQFIRNTTGQSITGLKDRPLNTAVNICTGLEIFNKLLKKFKMTEIKNYQSSVVKNIVVEVLDNNKEAHSEVEKILCLYNDMIEDQRAYGWNDNLICRDDKIYIKTSEMFNQIYQHMKTIGSNMPILAIGDFKKQARMAGYLLDIPSKQIKIKTINKKCDAYDTSKISALGLNAMAPLGYSEQSLDDDDQIIFPEFASNKK